MSAWNISASQDLLATLAQLQTTSTAKNTSAVNNSSDYAKILSQQIAQVEEEFNSANENSATQEQEFSTSNTMPVIETITRFRPDGSIMITTYKDGKIDSSTKLKPHLVPMPDFSAPKTPEGNTDIKYEKRFTVAELLML